MAVDAAAQSPFHWEIISGKESILKHKALLVDLAARCSQEGVLDFLEYLIAEPYFTLHVPRFGSWTVPPFLQSLALTRDKLPRLMLRRTPSGVDAAILLLEYALHGLGTRCFIPFDEDGYRSVVALEPDRAKVALEAGEVLIKRGAMLALLSFMAEPSGLSPENMSLQTRLMGFQSREVRRKLPLSTSFELTVASMSRNTRHNLRRAKDQLIRHFGAAYSESVTLTDEELDELNRDSSFAPPLWAVKERYQAARTLPGGVLVGVIAADGRWLSLIGAHRENNALCLDWQINRTSLGKISVATGARAFLMEAQASAGANCIRFERGTTHPIQGAFLVERTHDLVFATRLLPVWLLKSLFTDAKGGLLPTALASPAVVWRS